MEAKDATTRSNLPSDCNCKLPHRQRGSLGGADDTVADVWDRHIATPALALFIQLIREKINPGALILDADADTASRTMAILQHCQPSEIIALVASEAMVDVAKAEFRDPRVRFMQADVGHLPFAENIFDVVACTWFMECLNDPQAVVQECVRVTKPGGFVIYAFCGLFVVRHKYRQEYAEGRNDQDSSQESPLMHLLS